MISLLLITCHKCRKQVEARSTGTKWPGTAAQREGWRMLGADRWICKECWGNNEINSNVPSAQAPSVAL